MNWRVLIMAGGTGGHVFPALAVADKLRQQQVDVAWIGTERGIEAKRVPAAGYTLNTIPVQGLRGKGVMRWLTAPFKLIIAIYKAVKVIRQFDPDVVLGLGGFASGPGGVAAKLCRKVLIIHEQNAVPGLTNKLLARLADIVLAGFPNSFGSMKTVRWVGNPVREDIENLPAPHKRMQHREGNRHILVLGGSLGAKTLNTLCPAVFATMTQLEIKHQCGELHLDACRNQYQKAGVQAEITPFIQDMAAAYAWADIVICRAGALTVAELAAAGVASILIPFPHAVDDHQTRNAHMLTQAGAAMLFQEKQLTVTVLKQAVTDLLDDKQKRIEMAECARKVAKIRVAETIAALCMEGRHYG